MINMENENVYSLSEVMLGEGDRYLDNRMIIMNDTLGTVDSIAQLLQGLFEENKLIGNHEYEDYPEELTKLIHQIIKNEDGECSIVYELHISKSQTDNAPMTKTIYVYDKNFMPENEE